MHLIRSSVVMDIAAFKVSHSVDIDAAALRAARARSKSIGAMERYTWVRFAGKLTADCHTTHSNGQNTSVDEMSRKVQNASTHILRRQSHEHVHSNRSVQGPVQGGDG